jgi:hypothetical protein
MYYLGYDKEIELPCPRLSLYLVKSLTLQMEKKEPPWIALWFVLANATLCRRGLVECSHSAKKSALKCCQSGNTRPVLT